MTMDRFTAFEGNLAADPELSEFEDGNASCRFRLLNNPQRMNRKGEIIKEPTIGLNCVARDPFARTIAQRAKKGDRFMVWGQIRTRAYTDRDGNQRHTDYLQVEAAGPSWRFEASGTPEADTGAAPEEPPAEW